ncbi:MAG TPA: cation:proton antiporter [Stellaceae bacterium]|nr:cation:proton antiporter [Stellaceae bacterium]
MPHGPPLVTTLVVSLAVAYAGGLLARMVRLPPLVGYLLAGVVLGPFTPGLFADRQIVEQLAEIGVALLLFGVGLHFSFGDLAAVWRTAVPGALLQAAASAALSFGVGIFVGFTPRQAAVFAVCLAVASTVVATRALGERGSLQSQAGRVALGWLVMQDLIVVGVLVLLPAGTGAAAAGFALAAQFALKLGEVLAFAAAMLLVGRRVIPWLLAHTARDGSHELFRLAVIVAALGIATATTELIGVSPALGAFFAGVVIADSDISHQAAGESVPVQQVFTVLFFVSVGMLFDPTAVARVPLHIAAAAAVVLIGNCLLTFVILAALRAAPHTAVEVAAAIAQIGEFSFILSGAAVARNLLPPEGRDLVLAAALISILLQPAMFRAADRLGPRLEKIDWLRRWHTGRREIQRRGAMAVPDRHAIIVGHGRVGSLVAAGLRNHGIPYVVIEQDLHFAELLRRDGIPVVYGDAAWPEVLDAAAPDRARLLVIAVPDKGAARRILAAARRANPAIDVVARTHSSEEADWLARNAVSLAAMGERHAASEMTQYALRRFAAPQEG